MRTRSLLRATKVLVGALYIGAGIVVLLFGMGVPWMILAPDHKNPVPDAPLLHAIVMAFGLVIGFVGVRVLLKASKHSDD